MESSVSDVIYDRFFAELQNQAPWGSEVADRLRVMKQSGELRPDALVRDLFLPLATVAEGGE